LETGRHPMSMSQKLYLFTSSTLSITSCLNNLYEVPNTSGLVKPIHQLVILLIRLDLSLGSSAGLSQ